VSIWVSIPIIVCCAVLWDAGVVLQKQAADALPVLHVGQGGARSIWRMVASKRWLAGLVLSGVGWGLFAWALSFTPVSLARSIQGAGFVLLAVFSALFLASPPSRLEWVSVAVVTGGVALIGFSDGGVEPPPPVLHLPRFVGVTVLLVGVCLGIFFLRRVFGRGPSWVVVFAVAAGTLLGLGDVFTKALIVATEEGRFVGAAGVWGPLLVLSYLSGVTILTRAYQSGSAIVVTGVSDLCARIATLAVGVGGLGESFPADSPQFELRLVGLVAVLSGAVLLARFSAEPLKR
jgi:drug/metabolite transporter (DMT)-like permease